ncbi:hypothetical protein [Viridibacillus arvi]|uniref:hypothetical protein n=1 Tax=Viridibacillus arvi TaxID=263475 RepID=UPI0034CF95FD
MKITSLNIVYIIIMIPLLLYAQWRTEDTSKLTQLNKQYDSALTTASQDATKVLRTNVVPQLEAGYSSLKINPANSDVALKTFLHTLALNFELEDENSVDVLSQYIPVFSVLEYDGLSLNVFQESKDKDNNKIVKRTWLPKVPFSYSDKQGNIINFTIDQNVEVYVASLNEWFEGTREDVLNDITVDLNIGELEEESSDNQPNLAIRSGSEKEKEVLTVSKNITSKLYDRLSEETKTSVSKVLPKKIYTRFIESLKQSESEFDIPADILDELMNTLSDDLFDKVIVELATVGKNEDKTSCQNGNVSEECFSSKGSSNGSTHEINEATTTSKDKKARIIEDTPKITNDKLSILLLANEDEFEQVRKQTIVSTMQEEFAYYINVHNTYTKQLDINYEFAIPLISQEDWYNTVDDVGVFAFIQGYPFKRVNDVYNQHAFAGARIFRSEVIFGSTVDNKKVFYNKSCGFDYKATEIFNTKKEAAKEGYREMSCLNKLKD